MYVREGHCACNCTKKKNITQVHIHRKINTSSHIHTPEGPSLRGVANPSSLYNREDRNVPDLPACRCVCVFVCVCVVGGPSPPLAPPCHLDDLRVSDLSNELASHCIPPLFFSYDFFFISFSVCFVLHMRSPTWVSGKRTKHSRKNSIRVCI